MNTTTVHLQTVTRVLLHGAYSDSDGAPELRAPSIRGIMRYWFRAAAASVIGDRNINGLRQLEGAVFGQVNENQAAASPINIRIPQISFTPISTHILPHTKKGERKAIPPGTAFDIVLSSYRRLEHGEWDCALAALQLAITFGGLGQRSRRGYGTVRITGYDGAATIFPHPIDITRWHTHLNSLATFAIGSITSLARQKGVPIGILNPSLAAYPATTRLGRLQIGSDGYSDPQSAVIDLMQRIHNFLGTPANQPSRYLGFVAGTQRQASPLWVRVIETHAIPDRPYNLLFTTLASNFIGNNYTKIDALLAAFGGTPILLPGWNV